MVVVRNNNACASFRIRHTLELFILAPLLLSPKKKNDVPRFLQEFSKLYRWHDSLLSRTHKNPSNHLPRNDKIRVAQHVAKLAAQQQIYSPATN